MRKRRYGADHPRRVRLEDQDAMHYIIRARGVTKDTNHRSIILEYTRVCKVLVTDCRLS